MLIEETQNKPSLQNGRRSSSQKPQDPILKHLQSQHLKHEYLIKWFEIVHTQLCLPQMIFTSESLFDDKYLLQILSLCVPSDFHCQSESEEDFTNLDSLTPSQRSRILEKESEGAELKLFAQLKNFCKERQLDLTEVLKTIRIKKQAKNKQYDYSNWQNAYWQLVQTVFTVFYIENSQNAFLERYFQIQIREDLKQMKLVLEMVSSVMRKCKDKQEKSTSSSQNQRESIMIIEEVQANQDTSQQLIDHTEFQQNSETYIINMNENDPYSVVTTEKQQTRGMNESPFIQEEENDWDAFDDHAFSTPTDGNDMNKFQQQPVQEEQSVQSPSAFMEEESPQAIRKRQIEKQLERLEQKIRHNENILKSKSERESNLLNEALMAETKMQMKQVEIEQLNQRMVLYETFKHKFDMKNLETEELLERVEELSMVNGGLEDHIRKYEMKNIKLRERIEDLRINMKTQKSLSNEEIQQQQKHQQPVYFKKPTEVKVKASIGHGRHESSSSMNSYSHHQISDCKNVSDSLQEELYMDSHAYGMNICMRTKPTLEDEEIGENHDSLQTQYRFDTHDEEIFSQYELADAVTTRNSMHEAFYPPPEIIEEEDKNEEDLDTLRDDYKKANKEKIRFRKLYHELQERSFHYQAMMSEYEKLYSEFLGKCIKTEKEKVELSLKLQRANWLQSMLTNACSSVNNFRTNRNMQVFLSFILFASILIIAFLLLLLF